MRRVIRKFKIQREPIEDLWVFASGGDISYGNVGGQGDAVVLILKDRNDHEVSVAFKPDAATGLALGILEMLEQIHKLEGDDKCQEGSTVVH